MCLGLLKCSYETDAHMWAHTELGLLRVCCACADVTPIFFAWEKLIGTHEKPAWIRLPSRLPVGMSLGALHILLLGTCALLWEILNKHAKQAACGECQEFVGIGRHYGVCMQLCCCGCWRSRSPSMASSTPSSAP